MKKGVYVKKKTLMITNSNQTCFAEIATRGFQEVLYTLKLN